MKKFLIMLMVVAMASFLFVGCVPGGVTPDVPDEPDEPVLPASITPVINEIEGIGLYSSDIQYINEDEAEGGILVTGFAPKYSTVQVYIDGVVVSDTTAYGVLEWFTVFVSEDKLGEDGEKVLYATATEVGFEESGPSTTYAFTLDVVAPTVETFSLDDEEVSGAVFWAVGDPVVKKVTVEMSEPVKSGSADADEIYYIEGSTFDAATADIYGAFTISKDKLTLTVTPLAGLGEFPVGKWTYGVQENVLEDLAGNPCDDSKTLTFIEYTPSV